MLRPQDTSQPSEGIGAWTRDLFQGRHPTFRPDCATIVEDTRSKAIVSSVLLISQTWAFGGVPIAVGQPELIATHPDYRERGLVRAQLEVVHGWSAARGHQLLAINRHPGVLPPLRLRAGAPAGWRSRAPHVEPAAPGSG